ncbi:Aspartate beta-hydroxylase domain-containing protein 2 [Seminavis robusta]|uniref:Aspartate beta-hydroxylase domain-containing protein 2 n=1 Tax=Seminavis robusta TaxID=568900 RepID=A0A9N8E540_9STRA|nr:Aspartate beta-hydroxylase domain-containing protein 2 [Seminavis robusta]|eukprot:Sro527_g160700.1 Aspartate beta-hydroxylase domain-containing protein 2 (338) ;mRNA; r:40602-41708
MLLRRLPSLLLLFAPATAFVPRSPSRGGSSRGSTSLAALSERQQQFWEDVESGLDDIADFYQSKRNLDIDRIRLFGKSARGEIDPPKGSMEGHDPSEEHVDGLTARPFWDAADMPEEFPWAPQLEEKADIIQQEFAAKLAEQESQMFASDSAWQNQVMGGGWSAVRLQRLGVWNEENCRQFPQTYELIRSLNIPLAVRGVCFARQAPGSGVQPHSDGRNFILTSHLGLKIPEACWIEVGTERRGWEEGKLTTLDTSFTHSTGNPSSEDRHVLIIDYWHPELSEAERAALEFVYDLRNKFESGLVPMRRPRGTFAPKDEQQEEGGLGAWFSKNFGGDN